MVMTVQMNESYYTYNRVEEVISTLKSLTHNGDYVDGETMQYILERVGMDNQMLRQLIMSQPIDEVYNAYEERVQLERFVYKEK
jgi:tRNA-dihydrouridine synthase